MKKMITAIAVMGLMAVSAFGLDGKITKINFSASGDVWVTVTPTDGSADVTKKVVGATADDVKAKVAAVLTAKSTNSNVAVFGGNINGESGWKGIVLQ